MSASRPARCQRRPQMETGSARESASRRRGRPRDSASVTRTGPAGALGLCSSGHHSRAHATPSTIPSHDDRRAKSDGRGLTQNRSGAQIYNNIDNTRQIQEPWNLIILDE